LAHAGALASALASALAALGTDRGEHRAQPAPAAAGRLWLRSRVGGPRLGAGCAGGRRSCRRCGGGHGGGGRGGGRQRGLDKLSELAQGAPLRLARLRRLAQLRDPVGGDLGSVGAHVAVQLVAGAAAGAPRRLSLLERGELPPRRHLVRLELRQPRLDRSLVEHLCASSAALPLALGGGAAADAPLLLRRAVEEVVLVVVGGARGGAARLASVDEPLGGGELLPDDVCELLAERRDLRGLSGVC